MKITLPLAAIAGASLVAIAVAFVLRPTQLAPHSAPELSIVPEASRAVPAPRPQIKVYVAGAVVHPGVYAVSAAERAQDALAKAGGATRDADLVAVNLAAHVADGDEIAVPHRGEARTTGSVRSGRDRTPSAGTRTRGSPRRPAALAPELGTPAIDLNHADAATLTGLPGIGPTLAERIVAFRRLNGPFASVDGLADVAGITPQRLDALAPLLTTGR